MNLTKIKIYKDFIENGGELYVYYRVKSLTALS